jgi:hypothetical protein
MDCVYVIGTESEAWTAATGTPGGPNVAGITWFTADDEIGRRVPDGTQVYYRCVYTDDPSRPDVFPPTQVTWPPAAAADRTEAIRLFQASFDQLPAATVRTSPPQGQAALVGMPFWLYVADPWETVRFRNTAGSVWVDITATPVRTRWTFVAPNENPEGRVTRDCEGRGTDWETERPAEREADDPNSRHCGIVIWRTGGEHPAHVEVTWSVSATSNLGPFAPVDTTVTTTFTYRTKGTHAVRRR